MAVGHLATILTNLPHLGSVPTATWTCLAPVLCTTNWSCQLSPTFITFIDLELSGLLSVCLPYQEHHPVQNVILGSNYLALSLSCEIKLDKVILILLCLGFLKMTLTTVPSSWVNAIWS